MTAIYCGQGRCKKPEVVSFAGGKVTRSPDELLYRQNAAYRPPAGPFGQNQLQMLEPTQCFRQLHLTVAGYV